MENPGVLNWRRWSIVRKAQVIGAVMGGVGTTGFSLVLSAFNDPHQIIDFPAVVQLVICLPTWIVLKSIGMESKFAVEGDQWPLFQFFLIGLVNATLLFIVGSFVGWIVQSYKNRKKPPTV